MRFAHTNIVSRDWRALVDFYTAAFDCELVPPIRQQSGDWLDKGTGMKNARLEGAHLLLPGHGRNGPTLEIYGYDTLVSEDSPPPNMTGLRHLAFEVENVEESLGRVQGHGGTAQGAPTTRSVPGAGILTFVYARDPEGNLIELQSWQRED